MTAVENQQDIIKHLKCDPKLAAVIDKVGSYKIQRTKNKYKALVEAVITQQISGAAAESISTRFKKIYQGSAYPKPPDVADTPDSILRDVGISRMKIKCIKTISANIKHGTLHLDSLSELSNEDVIKKLCLIPGIGRWTSEMFLIFSLGRLDVLPSSDLGVRRGIKSLYLLQDMPTYDEVTKIAQIWRPYRTVAIWYIWRSEHIQLP